MGTEPVRAFGEPRVPGAAHIDPSGQGAFLRRHLLARPDGFVRDGGAKIKLVVGATGAGKTHFLGNLLAAANDEGFLTAHVDAAVRPLGGFDLLYQALAAELDFADLARRFAERVLHELGYPHPVLGPGETLAAWAAARGHEVRPLRVKWDEACYRRLAANPDLDYGYAAGLMRWCEGVLWDNAGVPDEGTAPRGGQAGGLLEHWLRGGRVGMRDCNRLRLRRCADRFTARLWLRSLLYFIRMAGLPGLVAALDGLDVLGDGRPRRGGGAAAGGAGGGITGAVGPATPDAGAEGGPAGPASAPVAADPGRWSAFADGNGTARPHYTKQRRDDLYECLRALIDDMGQMPGLLLLLAVPPALMDKGNLKTGLLSYPALAERLQNEVETVEINRFADEIVLERLWAADPEAGRALAERLIAAVAPAAGAEVRQRALAAARAQWAVRDVAVSAVRRSVLAVLELAGAPGARGTGGDGGATGPDVGPEGTAGVSAGARDVATGEAEGAASTEERTETEETAGPAAAAGMEGSPTRDWDGGAVDPGEGGRR